MKVINIITSTVLVVGTLLFLAGNLTMYCSRGLLTNNLFCVARLNLP